MRPGVSFRDVHFIACRGIAAGLKGLGVMKGDVDEAVAAGAHAICMPHGLGHMMGLDVHDMEDLGEQWVGYAGQPKSTQFGLKSLRLARRLEPGFVLTIEPGIYFIEALLCNPDRREALKTVVNWDRVDDLMPIGGIRIEDDVVVTRNEPEVLSRGVPKAMDDIEALMRG